MKIRIAEKKDFRDILNVVEKVDSGYKYNFVVKEALIASFLDNYWWSRFLVIENDGEILGFLGYSRSKMNYRFYEIFHLMVLPDWQKKGLGTKLMKKAIADIKKDRRLRKDDITIMVTSQKYKYFEKFGFKTLKKIKVNGSHFMVLEV